MKKMTGYASIDKPQDKGHTFFERNPIIPDMSIYNAIQAINYFYKDKKAIDCLDLTVDYNKLINDSVTISRALKELGVKKGQIVSISMPNYYQAVASFMACNRIGAIATFLNAKAEEEEICQYLNLFESPVFINFDKSDEENMRIKNKTGVRNIVTLKKDDVSNPSLIENYKIISNDDIIDFNDLGTIAQFQKKGLPSNSKKDDALILFTSGSTGNPKSVVLTNENILAAGTYLKNSSRVKNLNGNRTLVCVPFMYPYGFSTSTLITLLSGKTAILAPDISNDTIKYYLKKNPNIIFGSPALLNLIIKNTDKDADLSSITTYVSGGDFLTPAVYEKGKKFFEEHGAHNVEIGNGAGNAETVSCGTNPVGIEIRPETTGKVLVGTSAMILNDKLEEQKYGEEGTLYISGKHVFKEYYKNKEETKKAKILKDGKEYFKTGMLGYIDEDGYFTLTGRESRFYIISTLDKVYCDHVQKLIDNIPGVEESAVVQVPDDDMLFVNKVYIVLNENSQGNKEVEEKVKESFYKPIELDDGTLKQLKYYEIPDYVEFVKELPRKEDSNKIDYDVLEKDAKEKLSQGGKVKKLILSKNK